MPDVISDTNGKLCVGSYHMWRLLSNPDNYSLSCYTKLKLCSSLSRERSEFSNGSQGHIALYVV